MQFNAPDVVTSIRDVAEIYRVNDVTGRRLDSDLEGLEDDIFLEICGERKLSRIEALLGISPKDTDGLESRRLAVMAGLNDRVQCSMKGLKAKIEAMCGKDNFTLDLDFDRELMHFSLTLAAKNNYTQITDMLDNVLPLNMVITGEILYHTYSSLKNYTYAELAGYECGYVREI